MYSIACAQICLDKCHVITIHASIKLRLKKFIEKSVTEIYNIIHGFVPNYFLGTFVMSDSYDMSHEACLFNWSQTRYHRLHIWNSPIINIKPFFSGSQWNTYAIVGVYLLMSTMQPLCLEWIFSNQWCRYILTCTRPWLYSIIQSNR